MSTPESCRLCSKSLTALADLTGLCEECLRTTDRTVPTVPEELTTRAAAVSPTDSTAFFSPSLGTRSVPTGEPEPLVVSARLLRLHDLGWLDVRRICHGGMGELFTGYDPGLQLQLVAKFIRPDAVSESTRNRFRVEAASLARLKHDNVARLFMYVEGEDPFLVTEFVEGGTLGDRLKGGLLSATDAAEILEGVARGVAAAHADGVIHRDLKPSNVLLDRTADRVVPKVTDFGIAKDVAALESLTQGHAILGTPEYMSPEQARSQSADCDARSDVWGLAATLYSAVTGQPPFTRDLLLPPVLREPLTPPESLAPNLPPDLAAVIRMGLEKHPNDRYQTATEFADDLARYRARKPVLARRRTWPVRAWRRAQRLPKVATAAVLVAVVATVALGSVLQREPVSVAPREHPDVADQRRLDNFMAELARGRSITLMGESGVPVFTEQGFGEFASVRQNGVGNAFGLHSVSTGVCLLTGRLPIDRYEVSFDLAEIASLPTDRNAARHQLGVVVGFHRLPAPPGATVAHCLAATWDDFQPQGLVPQPPIRGRVRMVSQLLVHAASRSPNWPSEPFAAHDFDPSRIIGAIGAWRTIRVAVAPTEVTFTWQIADKPGEPMELLATVTADELARRANFLTLKVPEYLPGWAETDVPPFDPCGAIGLWVDRCSFAVRNVRVTPTTAGQPAARNPSSPSRGP